MYKIVLYRLKKGARYLQFYVRGDDAAARAVKLVGTDGEALRVAPMSGRRIKISDSSSRIDAWRGTRSLERRQRSGATASKPWKSKKLLNKYVTGVGGGARARSMGRVGAESFLLSLRPCGVGLRGFRRRRLRIPPPHPRGHLHRRHRGRNGGLNCVRSLRDRPLCTPPSCGAIAEAGVPDARTRSRRSGLLRRPARPHSPAWAGESLLVGTWDR